MLNAIRKHVAVKSILGIVLMLLVFSAIVLYIGFKGFTEEMLAQYSGEAFETAERAAKIVNPDRMEVYDQSGGTTEEFAAVWDRLDYLCNATGSTFIYVIEPDRTDWAHITFIFSTINQNSGFEPYAFGFVRDTTNDEYKMKYARIYDHESERELVIRDRGYIETDPHITAMVGLEGSDGEIKGILCVQRQMDVLASARQRYIHNVLLALAGLGALVIVGQSLFLNRTLLKPLTQISQETTRFATENTPAETKLADTISNTDEVGRLAADIDTMEERIEDYVENIMEVTADKERMSTELNLAGRIQSSMLPSIFPAFPERSEFDLYASMDPAKEVGGDFYDFFLVDEDHLAIVIADVSDKGIPAALFMMASKMMINGRAFMSKSPAAVMESVNDSICASNEAQMFVTVWLGFLELSTGKLVAVNAGHEYPAIKRKDGPFELFRDEHGLVVGAMEDISYKDAEYQLNPGDKLFVYTDGVPEAQNAEHELFGLDRLTKALNDGEATDVRTTIDTVREKIEVFVGDAPQFDDVTMVCLEYKGVKTEAGK